MTRIFGEKLDWKHVAIVVLVLAIAYFIWKHNGIKGAYYELVSDLDQVDPGVKEVKGKHRGETLTCKEIAKMYVGGGDDQQKLQRCCNSAKNNEKYTYNRRTNPWGVCGFSPGIEGVCCGS